MNRKEIMSNRVWKTKKCRMNAAARLEKHNRKYEFLNIIYSIIIIGLSIINLKPDDKVSALLLIASISLTIFTLFVNSINFRERHNSLKRNYLNLNNMEAELDLIDENNKEQICQFTVKYNKTLEEAENHKDIDLLLTLKDDSETKFTKGMKFKLLFLQAKEYLLFLLLLVLPFIIYWITSNSTFLDDTTQSLIIFNAL